MIVPLVTARARGLLALYGVGHDTAAKLLIAAGDHPERLRSEAAWAHLCATAPIPASSGKVTRHGLDPAGDRQANHAVYRIVIARMSSHPAPVNGVLVGERTFRETRAVIEYRQAEPVQAKGKREPVADWEAVRARARPGAGVPPRAGAALVGRERELGVLQDVLAQVRAERSPQLVTLVGVPGIGKSRLLDELSRVAAAEDGPVWRQGRSLPYGDGVSFWALAEMVKAQAGILESDSRARLLR